MAMIFYTFLYRLFFEGADVFETISLLQIIVVAASALITSTITSMVGAGGGTALVLVMLYVLPPAAVVPVHGCIQLVANITRVSLMWRYMNWPIILRFISLMPIGVYLGLQLYNRLEPTGIQLIIAAGILISLFARAPQSMKQARLPKSAYIPIGLVIGFGNMIVGTLAPLLAAILRLEVLSKEQTVATLGFFGLMGNVFKIAGFTFVGFAFLAYLPLIIPASIATIAGGFIGKGLLLRSSNQFFNRAFKAVIALLSIKMIFDVFMG